MYLTYVSSFFIKGSIAQVALAFLTVREIQTTTAETVRRSQNATVSALATYHAHKTTRHCTRFYVRF